MPQENNGEHLDLRKPKRLRNPIHEFLLWPRDYPLPCYVAGTRPLPEDHATNLEQLAAGLHSEAAKYILGETTLFPPGSIGLAWALKVRGPRLHIVKRGRP